MADLNSLYNRFLLFILVSALPSSYMTTQLTPLDPPPNRQVDNSVLHHDGHVLARMGRLP